MDEVTVTGTIVDESPTTVTVNGTDATVMDNQVFSAVVPLTSDGEHVLTATASDAAGNTAEASVTVIRDTTPPVITLLSPEEGLITSDQTLAVTGTVSDLTPTLVDVNGTSLPVDEAGNFSGDISLVEGLNELTIMATDSIGNSSSITRAVTLGTILPDPADVAPPIDQTVVTTIGVASAFLYTGDNPIQSGVAAGTIDPLRAAVIRGRVLARDASALSGALITIKDHPEFGSTLSRIDGAFDMVVNGGDQLVISYSKDDFLTVQRPTDIRVQDYTVLDDVVLIGRDPMVTTVDFSEPAQVARGTPQSDADGTRQATVMFKQGTTAEMIMPDGSAVPLTSLNVRATEATVGEMGPNAMPAPLPGTSAYTYAVELSVDEAVAAGARAVRFSEPIPFYVENFLGFPVGLSVPVGTYDAEDAEWVPEANGRIIGILGVTGGLADIDVDGDGVSDGGTALTDLGIDDAERERLATLYTPGTSLWRARTTHFSWLDLNYPRGPSNNRPPNQKPPVVDPPVEKQCEASRSIIGCQQQTLGEVLPIAGTPYQMRYASDRVPGRVSQLQIAVTGDVVPDFLERVEVQIAVAGRQMTETFLPVPNQNMTFRWDGRDVYGRPVQGRQPITVQIDYVYPFLYGVPASAAASFGLTCTGSTTGVLETCIIPATLATRARAEARSSQTWHGLVGSWANTATGLGGWSLDVHHAYDPIDRSLYLGNGERRREAIQGRILTRVAGGGTLGGPLPDGVLATDVKFLHPFDIAFGPDGSYYITHYNDRGIVYRVGTDGRMFRFAGGGPGNPALGDGGPARSASLRFPLGIDVGPDGSVYIASDGRIRVVTPDGIIKTFAGTGQRGYNGDGIPATEAELSPNDVAVGPDGSVYVADGENNRIRRIGTDGIIHTVAGTGQVPIQYSRSAGYGGLATSIDIGFQKSISVGADGTLYFAQSFRFGFGEFIRKVTPDGFMTALAGGGAVGSDGDGIPANDAFFNIVDGIGVAGDGSVYFTESWPGRRIRRINGGIIATVAGSGLGGTSGSDYDGLPATAAGFDGFGQLTEGLDGRIYFSGRSGNSSGDTIVWRIEPVFPGLGTNEVVTPSEDGREVYVLNVDGRHLRTLDALTGAVTLDFAYDERGLLASITDGDGLRTAIERDSEGHPLAIVAPFGQRTALTVNADGYLSSVTNPADETVQMEYTVDGLLTRLTDPLENPSQFAYDELGRLTRDQDAGGGAVHLARTELEAGFEVTKTSPEDRATTYRVESLATGDQSQVNTFPTGSQAQVTIRRDGSSSATFPDGTVADLVVGPDPRWGMLAPILKSLEVRTPGGLNYSATATRQVTLSNPRDPFSVVTGTDSVNINGRVYTRTLDVMGDLSRLTFTSPEGRQSTITFDRNGRPVEFLRDPSVVPITYSHDAVGRLEHINVADQSLTYGYDALGRIASRTVADGSQTLYGYDGADRLTSTQLPSGLGYGFGYDNNGNRTTVAMPSGSEHGLTYTPFDMLAGYTAPGGPTYRKTFTMDRALDRIDLAGGRTVDLTQDAFGRATGMIYPEATITWGYADLTQRVTQLSRTPTGASPQNLTFTYDGDLITSTTWSGLASGQITYRYDNNFFLVGVQVDNEPELVVTNDRDGLPTGYGPFTLTRGGPSGATTQISDGVLSQSYSYDNLGRIANRSQTVGGRSVYSMQLTYNNLGQLSAKTETSGGVTVSYGYVYDADGQVIEVLRDGVVVERYAYDQNGNRISRQVGAGPVETASYDVQDRLLQQGTVSYEVDTDGYLVARGGSTFQYSARGELLEVTADGQSVSYGYDALHRRVSRSDASGTYQFLYGDAYDDMRITAYRDPSGVLAHVFYDDAGLLYALQLGTTFYYIATDQVGSPLMVSAASGALVKRVEYDSFGNIVFDSNPDFDLPFGFAGGLLDRATGLLRFGWRDYDPLSGRWTTRDPVGFEGGQFNLYSYISNDPVNRRDPSGFISVEVSAYDVIGGSVKVSVTPAGLSVCFAPGLGIGGDLDINLNPFPNEGLDPSGVYTRLRAKASYGPYGFAGEWRLCTDGTWKFIPRVDVWPLKLKPDELTVNLKDPRTVTLGGGGRVDVSVVVCIQVLF